MILRLGRAVFQIVYRKGAKAQGDAKKDASRSESLKVRRSKSRREEKRKSRRGVFLLDLRPLDFQTFRPRSVFEGCGFQPQRERGVKEKSLPQRR
jgi:hypothetical protein